ncbi:sigma-70 family RNA polymerase sigma factor [Mariniblastus sp.]|jgi:RNA polymerase sigma-70 factor, ECF subfamily|nr:sigma-70 family RNA polymerase sigma factor [Mariniblastus sp.]MDB2526269.1 sigma-70 family RNA polymerase sigma factor [Mariniblastus sp.]MDC0284181.1 sigma-70 family RNA polymerase sigma factor [Mariniblastus sp.]|eukprot:COSAG01_NODE_117_length_25466_cov_18.193243_13_plen_171_part_00
MKPNEQQRIFEEWLAQHKGLLFKVVRAYAFNSHDQDDLFQEMTTQVWNSVPRYRGESAVSTWIYRVAFYSAIGWSKKEKRHRDKHQAIQREDRLLSQRSNPENPQLEWLYEQISQLDEIDRSLTLLMLDGFSYREIGKTMGLSQNYVGVKLNRIKKRLTEHSKKKDKHGI